MISESLLSIANLFLPEVLVTYFDLKRYEIKGEELRIYFIGLKNAHDGWSVSKRHSKGFFPEATVQDFSYVVRTFFCTSYGADGLSRTTGAVDTRDSQLGAKGTRVTSEFAIFL